jgi:cell division initiation protein
MALTPVEIRHLTPPRTAFRGYKAAPTEKLLEEIAASFEDVWRERADLADKVEQLEADLVRFRELESLLRTTLVSAEQASAQMRDQARREAELILNEAHAEARDIQRRAIAENERLSHESRRLRAQLIDALSVFDEPAAAAAAEQEPEPTTPAEPDADTEAERSWYGYPSGAALPDADAA